MNKFIPLSSLKDTTGIVELCKKAGEPVVVNRNGEIDIEKYLIRKTIKTYVKKTF